jgi:hypothetical protein
MLAEECGLKGWFKTAVNTPKLSGKHFWRIRHDVQESATASGRKSLVVLTRYISMSGPKGTKSQSIMGHE